MIISLKYRKENKEIRKNFTPVNWSILMISSREGHKNIFSSINSYTVTIRCL